MAVSGESFQINEGSTSLTIRQQAGLKPTFGICPTDGHALGANVAPADILAIGPLGRGADDLTLGLDAIAGPNEIDAAGYRLALPRARKKTLAEYRIAVIADDATAPVEPVISARIRHLADFLNREGADVSEGALPDRRQQMGAHAAWYDAVSP